MQYVCGDDRDLCYAVLDSMPGIVVTDLQGRIMFLSEKYAEILQVDRKESVGKHVTEIIPGTRMHIVAKTGIEEMGSIFKLKNGETVLVNRMLVKKNGQVIGVAAFGSISERDEISTSATIEKINKLSQEVKQYKNELTKLRGAKYSLDRIIGNSLKIIKMKELIIKVAQTKSTALINGETGTGKELVAHAIHQQSNRNHQPFIRVNCAAIPSELMEAELFGYEEGAFTGARKGGKIGKFELANCGTILLDEINQMPLYMQSKLLRVIQEREIERVGGTRPKEIDVRFIFTTNQNLFDLVKQDKFREDLYYRINVVSIDIPPLRARLEDIPLLVQYFIKKINRELGLSISGIDEKVLKIFQEYHWPGNIRELENTIERAANIALHGKLMLKHFESFLLRIEKENYKGKASSLKSARNKAEKEIIIKALAQTNTNISATARLLGISRSVLYDKMKKYSIKMK